MKTKDEVTKTKDLENTPLECVIMIVSSIFIVLTLFGIWYLLRKSGSEEERKSLKIKDNNHILSWCYELNAISSSCERFIHSSKNLYKQEDKKINANEQNPISKELE